jgi:hypothetical protein
MGQWPAICTLELNVIQAKGCRVISGVPFRHVDAGVPPVLGPFRTAKATMEGNHKPVNDGLLFTEERGSFVPRHEGKSEPHGPSFTAIGNILPPFPLLEDLFKCRTQGVRSLFLTGIPALDGIKDSNKGGCGNEVLPNGAHFEREWPMARWHA